MSAIEIPIFTAAGIATGWYLSSKYMIKARPEAKPKKPRIAKVKVPGVKVPRKPRVRKP